MHAGPSGLNVSDQSEGKDTEADKVRKGGCSPSAEEEEPVAVEAEEDDVLEASVLGAGSDWV